MSAPEGFDEPEPARRHLERVTQGSFADVPRDEAWLITLAIASEACAYLAAPSAKFITGEVLTVDGGQQLWGDPWPTGRPDYFRL